MAVAVISTITRNALHFREAFKFSLSLALVYMIALAMNWERPFWAGLSVSLCSMATAGASLNKGAMRIIGCLVGCAAALVLVECFAQEPWRAMVALILYIFVLSVPTLVSTYWYAYKSTLLVTVLIVMNSYNQWDQTFTISVERTLETAMGVVVYTLVSALFWPRYAGDDLPPRIAAVFDHLTALSRLWRRQYDGTSVAAEFYRTRRAFLASLPAAEESLTAAFGDTESVRRNRRVWESLRRNIRKFYDAIVLLHESTSYPETHGLLPRALPEIDVMLERIDARLARVVALWEQYPKGSDVEPARDGMISTVETLTVNSAMKEALPFEQRAALVTWVEQLRILDESSRELLAAARVLAGLDSRRSLALQAFTPEPYRWPIWDPEVLLNAFRPVLTFILVFLGWMYVEGFPGGAIAIPLTMVVVTFIIREVPADPFKFARPYAIGIIVTAPAYFFILPALETPHSLFLFLFLFSFPWGYLGSRGDMFLKFWVMLAFLASTQINNAQVYSFQQFADFSLLLMWTIVLTALAFSLLPSTQPEKVFLRTLRAFFTSCARLVAIRSRERQSGERGLPRAPFHRARVTGLPPRLRIPAAAIDYDIVRGGTAEQVYGLLDSVQSVSFRLRALEDEREHAVEHPGGLYEIMRDVRLKTRTRLQELLEGWARLDDIVELGEKRERYRRELEAIGTRLYELAEKSELSDDRSLQVLFSTHVAHTALANTLERLEAAAKEMNLQYWALPRFSKP